MLFVLPSPVSLEASSVCLIRKQIADPENYCGRQSFFWGGGGGQGAGEGLRACFTFEYLQTWDGLRTREK